MDFFDFDFADEVLDGLDAMNFSEPTPIQEATIPPLLEGRDLLGCAQTGTGKTAAYLLPIINRIYLGEFEEGYIKAIVMAPTRELAQQIDQQITGFGYFVSISSLAIYGGTDGSAWAQAQRGAERGTDIVVATPGRLISMLNLQAADISHTSYFVIDEADRMLDMGFYDDIMSICRRLPKTCQIALFSATMPPKIEELARSILKDPVHVAIAISKPPETILQSAYICYEAQKLPIVTDLLSSMSEEKPTKTVVFSSSKLKVHQLATALKSRGVNVAEMHSDLDQTTREQVMRDFKTGYIEVLVATDIVARGIDIDDIKVVINYDMPHDPEDYVHRIGRTARGTDGRGVAITLVNEEEQRSFAALEHFLGYSIYKVPIGSEYGEAPKYSPKTSQKRYNNGGNRRRSKGEKQAKRSSNEKQKQMQSENGTTPKGRVSHRSRKPFFRKKQSKGEQ